jgi:hypothetical protein
LIQGAIEGVYTVNKAVKWLHMSGRLVDTIKQDFYTMVTVANIPAWGKRTGIGNETADSSVPIRLNPEPPTGGEALTDLLCDVPPLCQLVS